LLAIDHRYFLNRGDCYRGLSQLFDAIFDYEHAMELEPDNWEIRTRLSLAHYLLAVEQYNGAHFKQAENHLDCAIK